MNAAEDYLEYIRSVRRYSPRTLEIYSSVLREFADFALASAGEIYPSAAENSAVANAANFSSGETQKSSNSKDPLLPCFITSTVRAYEVHLMKVKEESAKTVNLHLSVLSGFAKYLIRRRLLRSNPVSAVKRPKPPRNLPEFYRKDSMDRYFEESAYAALPENLEIYASRSQKNAIEGFQKPFLEGDKEEMPSKAGKSFLYEKRLARLIVLLLYDTGIRRSELLSLTLDNFNFSRKVLTVKGKGDKMREIPLVPALSEEILLYLEARRQMFGAEPENLDHLLLTSGGKPLYPVYVDRVVKKELEGVKGITGRRSPHVLRHTLATELLDSGADLNSIKELLGHSSLAATQVYTHNSVEKLKKVYTNAHPRAKSSEEAKNGGENGD